MNIYDRYGKYIARKYIMNSYPSRSKRLNWETVFNNTLSKRQSSSALQQARSQKDGDNKFEHDNLYWTNCKHSLMNILLHLFLFSFSVTISTHLYLCVCLLPSLSLPLTLSHSLLVFVHVHKIFDIILSWR